MKRILAKINETLWDLAPFVTIFMVILDILAMAVMVIIGLIKIISLV